MEGNVNRNQGFTETSCEEIADKKASDEDADYIGLCGKGEIEKKETPVKECDTDDAVKERTHGEEDVRGSQR